MEKPETQNRRLEPTGLAKPCKSHRLTGVGPGLARQDTVGRVFEHFWNSTEPCLRSEPGPLSGHLDRLLTLPVAPQITQDTLPSFVDALLTLIIQMG